MQDTFGSGARSEQDMRMMNNFAGMGYLPYQAQAPQSAGQMSDYEIRLMEEARLMRRQPYIASPFGNVTAMNAYSQPMPSVSEQGFVPAFAQGVRDAYNTFGNFARQLPTELAREYGNFNQSLEENPMFGGDPLLSKAVNYLREMDMRRTEEIERDNALSRLQELLDQSRNYRENADANRSAQRMKPLSSYDKKEDSPKK